jgi:hypothetical protein
MLLRGRYAVLFCGNRVARLPAWSYTGPNASQPGFQP